MSILDKIKDNSNGYLKKFLQILTPLEYIEYMFKMLLVLDIKKVELCLLFSIILNIVLMLSGLVFNIGISNSGLVSSCVLNIIVYFGFTLFRKIKSRKTVSNYEIGEIKVKPIDVEDFEIPEALKRYTNNTSISEVVEEVTNSNLNNLIDTSNIQDHVDSNNKTKSVNLQQSTVDDLDLSSFNYEDYFKER